MAHSGNSKIKILYLLRILLEKTDDEHGLTLNEIIDELDTYGIYVERKTLYNDIETLNFFGLDVEKRKGKKFTYHVLSRKFEFPELKLLVDAVQASKFITHKKSDALIKKIESLTSVHQAQDLQRQVYVTSRIKNMNESIYYIVDQIHDAINKNVKISFQYFEWNENKEKVLRHDGKKYLVSPWALCWDDRNYYLIGYEKESDLIKHFRVDKMIRISLTEEERDGADLFKDFDMGVYSRKSFGMYRRKEANVTLRCKNSLAGVIIDRFGKDTVFKKVDDEHFEITVQVYTSPIFIGWLMSFGADIKVVSPDFVIEKCKNLAKEFLDS